MRHIKFPSIEQFRNAVKDVRYYYGEVSPPTITFRGTVKLHGTCAGVSYQDGEMWAQSRSQIVTVGADNAGFAAFVESKADVFRALFEAIAAKHDAAGQIITLFGEWAGLGIQKGVAVSELPRTFYIFGLCLSPVEKPADPNFEPQWLDYAGYSVPSHHIRNTLDFPSYELAIDFANPHLSQNQLVAITEAVEARCPVGAALGVEGVGEGVVWSAPVGSRMIRFKVKGEKHSVTKVKKLASVDVEQMESMRAFIESVVTPARIQQGVTEVCGIGAEPDIKRMGDVIRWVHADVIKEESDTMIANGLNPRNIGKPLSLLVRKWFLEAPLDAAASRESA